MRWTGDIVRALVAALAAGCLLVSAVRAQTEELDLGDDATEEADDAADEAAQAAADEAADEAAEEAADAAADEAADSAEEAAADEAAEDDDAFEDDDLPDADEDADENPGEDADEDGEGDDRDASGGDGDRQAEAREAGVDADAIEIEIDENGDEVVADEILAALADPAQVGQLRDAGFRIEVEEVLTGLGLELVRIRAPAAQARGTLDTLRRVSPQALFARNHLFTAGAESRPASAAAPAAVAGDARRGRVGLLDTAIDPAAVDPGVSVHPAEFGVPARDRGPGRGHGSAVASRLSDAGVQQIFAANVFSGRHASALSMLRALDWMAQQQVPVINISLAGPRNELVAAALAILLQRGHAVVAAVGNDGPAAPALYPAAEPGVVAVTAVDAAEQVYRRANRGEHVAFSAAGVDVPTRGVAGSAHRVSGTSFAAPVVSAALARRLERPAVAARDEALAMLVQSARDRGAPGRDPVYGYGVVQPR